MKKLFIISLLVASVVYFYFSVNSWCYSGYFRLVVFNVGQGDSILLVTPKGQTILIDGGPDDSVLRELGRTLPMWLRKIDLVILTHAHDDHLFGLIEILNRYQVGKIIINESGYNSPIVKAWQKLIIKNNLEIINSERGMIFNFDSNCFLKILEAQKNKLTDENNYSIVSEFSCLDRRVLLTGDASLKIEEDIISAGTDIRSDILKISHHGSITGTSLKILELINPRLAIISVGTNNKFGHPKPDVLNYLSNLHINTLRTDKNGTLYLFANNKEIILRK
jgi:competence protein ComEC